VLFDKRSDQDVDFERDIAPYSWMRERWQSGFFARASMPADGIPASEIRIALSRGREKVRGIPLNECLSQAVLRHIWGNAALLIGTLAAQMGNRPPLGLNPDSAYEDTHGEAGAKLPDSVKAADIICKVMSTIDYLKLCAEHAHLPARVSR